MKSIVKLIFLIPIVLGCYRCDPYCPFEPVTRTVIFDTEMLKNRWDLMLENSCIAYSQEEGIKKLNIILSSQEIVDLCDARFMLVDIVEALERGFNENPEIYIELGKPEFDYHDIDLIITYESFFGRYADLQYTNQIRMSQGCVTYYAFTAFGHKTENFEKHSEYFENTLAIVYAQRDAGVMTIKDQRLLRRQMETDSLQEVLEEI